MVVFSKLARVGALSALCLAACDGADPSTWAQHGSPAQTPPTACGGDVTPDPGAECPPEADPAWASIKMRTVSSRFHVDRHDDRSLQLTIVLDVRRDMPHVAPDLDVKVDCDGHRDDERAFFMSLNGAKKGAELEDRLELFRVRDLPAEPEACEYRMQLEGALTPKYWCFRNGATEPGRCVGDEAPKEPAEEPPLPERME